MPVFNGMRRKRRQKRKQLCSNDVNQPTPCIKLTAGQDHGPALMKSQSNGSAWGPNLGRGCKRWPQTGRYWGGLGGRASGKSSTKREPNRLTRGQDLYGKKTRGRGGRETHAHVLRGSRRNATSHSEAAGMNCNKIKKTEEKTWHGTSPL